jgi:hypothetical protein
MWMQYKRKSFLLNRKGVSEIVGTMLLLGIAVALFSVVYFSLLSAPTPVESPAIQVIASLDEQNENYNITVQHRGGDPVDANARFFVEIAGIRQEGILKDFIQNNNEQSDYWNFGEQLVYPLDNITGLQLDMGIADKHSNSLVLLGTLQEGYVVPGFGRGGIWHFDEDSGDTVYDSSGNNNHGTIYDGLRINGVNGTNGLEFDGIDDYVNVPFSPGINIRDEVSIEAWINASTREDLINMSEFDGKVGYSPDITHVHDDLYAVVYRNGSSGNSEGILKTVSIQSNGWITNVSLDKKNLLHECNEPKIITISDDVVAVAYGYSDSSNYLGIIETYHIDANGIIQPIADASFSLQCIDLSLTQVYDSIYAIAYGGGNNGGYLQIMNITSDGSITPINGAVSFDNSKCIEPDILHLNDNTFVIAYTQGEANKKGPGNMCTVNITQSGVISITGYQYPFSAENNVNYPSLEKISDDVLTLVYNDKNQGLIETIHVSSDGQMSQVDSFTFFNAACHDPDVKNIYEDTYLVAYRDGGGGGNEGLQNSIIIEADGLIDTVLPEKIFTTGSNQGWEPVIFKISDYIFGILYRDKSPHPGSIRTFTNIGDIPNPSNIAGIFKKDSFGIYANETHLIASINNLSPISISNLTTGWNHIVMTYDQSYIRLYVNGIFMKKQFYDTTINSNTNQLYIGKLYYGILDEVGLYDRVLSLDEISDHFNYPGSLG